MSPFSEGADLLELKVLTTAPVVEIYVEAIPVLGHHINDLNPP